MYDNINENLSAKQSKADGIVQIFLSESVLSLVPRLKFNI